MPEDVKARNERVQAAIKDAISHEDAAKPPVPEKPKSAEEKAFERLAKESAALRHEKERFKSLEGLSAKLPPGSLEALAKAKLSNDPEAALVALGWSYADIAERKLETPAGDEPGAKPAPKGDPTVSRLEQEVAELRKESAARRDQAAHTEALGKIGEFVKGKFALVEQLGESKKVADYLVDFWRKTGRAPGDTWEESMELAALAVEKDLEAEKARWEKILDKSAKSTTVDGEAPANASAGAGAPGKTLTNSMSSGAKPTTTSRAEILNGLMNDPRAWTE
jgi:hypothetical protein